MASRLVKRRKKEEKKRRPNIPYRKTPTAFRLVGEKRKTKRGPTLKERSLERDYG